MTNEDSNGERLPSLTQLMLDHDERQFLKLNIYIPMYERYFERFRGEEVTMLEIGIFDGGSLQLWRSYLGPKAKIVGIDINPECAEYTDDRIEVFIGDQADAGFLTGVLDEIGPVDIVLDDGGHAWDQQRVSFETIYPRMTDHGVYACEDMGTSYWTGFEGSSPGKSYVELMKDKVDELNGLYSGQINEVTSTTSSVCFHDCAVFVERAPHVYPNLVSAAGGSFNKETTLETLSSLSSILNLLDEDILELFDGVDRELAESIVATRQANGHFASAAELAAVKGMTADGLAAISAKFFAE